MLLWWGPDLIMLYNDAYRPILGLTKHPQALGLRGQASWPEYCRSSTRCSKGCLPMEATWSNDQLLVLDWNGYLEERDFNLLL